jgi:hypothetical protein
VKVVTYTLPETEIKLPYYILWNSDQYIGCKSFNPFQSNFSANRILPSSYLSWAGKRLVDYL